MEIELLKSKIIVFKFFENKFCLLNDQSFRHF